MTVQNPRKLKRAVIKEELVALTADWLSALILNQFLYWGERVKDFDKFILEERERDPDTRIELTHGWIYKSTKELKDELMINIAETTIRRRIQKLVDRGWVDERHNPERKWDRTLQYRPNIRKIQADLHELGYAIDGYSLLKGKGDDSDSEETAPEASEDPNLHGAECNLHGAECNLHGAELNLHRVESNLHHADSNLHGAEAIPKITTETTSENKTETTTAAKKTKKGKAAAALAELGFSPQDILQLEEQYNPRTILEAIDHLEYLQAKGPKKIRYPRRWLVSALKGNYSPPDGYRPDWREKAESESDEINKYINNKYSEYIEH